MLHQEPLRPDTHDPDIKCTLQTHLSPHFLTDERASSTVIGNILMLALTIMIAGVVTIQVMRFSDSLNFSGDMNDMFGRKKSEVNVLYRITEYEGNISITIQSIDKEIEISRVNYQLYNLSIKKSELDGYLLDIQGSNSTKIQFFDTDNDDHFSNGDLFRIELGNGTLENEYILKLSDNKRSDVVYEITILEEDIVK